MASSNAYRIRSLLRTPEPRIEERLDQDYRKLALVILRTTIREYVMGDKELHENAADYFFGDHPEDGDFACRSILANFGWTHEGFIHALRRDYRLHEEGVPLNELPLYRATEKERVRRSRQPPGNNGGAPASRPKNL